MKWIGTFTLCTSDIAVICILALIDMGHGKLTPLQTYDVSGHIAKSATMRCVFETDQYNRGWFLITWSRIKDDGTALQYVRLPVQSKRPEWGKHVTARMRSRMNPVITLQPGHVEFNLHIRNLTCDDEAYYRCSVVTPEGELLSTAQLIVFSVPKPPEITVDYQMAAGQNHIRVQCKADVGLPPKMLVWYTKPPGDVQFTPIDRQPHSVSETDGCHFISSRTVDVDVTDAISGTEYRCGYHGNIEKSGMFDKWVLHIENPKQGDEAHYDRPENMPRCRGERCNIGRQMEENDKNLASPLAHSGCSIYCVVFQVACCCLLVSWNSR